jgi:thioredoxin-like negative regulator of GroEL
MRFMKSSAKPKAAGQVAARGWQIAILAVVVIAIGVILIVKAQPSAPTSASNATPVVESPEAMLDRALAAKQPTLAFFHSLTCDSCVEMTAIVEQVYPEFRGAITLVDVNVYEARNQALLQRAGIRAIPTLVFIDSAGQGQMFMGVMEAAQLRQTLQTLAGSN